MFWSIHSLQIAPILLLSKPRTLLRIDESWKKASDSREVQNIASREIFASFFGIKSCLGCDRLHLHLRCFGISAGLFSLHHLRLQVCCISKTCCMLTLNFHVIEQGDVAVRHFLVLNF